MTHGRTGLTVPVDRAALAVTSLAAAGIHFAVMGRHFSEYVVFGIFFAAVAWLQALWAIGVVMTLSRRLLLAGAIGNAIVVLVWVISRTTGLPLGPEAGTPEPATFVDVLSTILELFVVAGALIVVLQRQPLELVRGRAAFITVIGLTLALAVVTTVAVAASDHGGQAPHEEVTHEEIGEVRAAPVQPGSLASISGRAVSFRS
jgi:uncharacterized BrkB/YihY/UPF0761 family membrane protein